MSKFLKAFLFVSLVFAPFAASAVTVASWGGAYTESCLLYTSPSPRDRTTSRMPSSA